MTYHYLQEARGISICRLQEGMQRARSSQEVFRPTRIRLKRLAFLLLVTAAVVAACGDGGSMGEQAQNSNAVMGSDGSMMPDGSMTPTPTMPMMGMMSGMSRKAR